MKIILSVAIVFFLSMAQNSFAINGQKGDWEVGPYAGFIYPDDYSPAGNLQNGWLVGGRIGYSLNQYISFEPSYQHAFTKTFADAGTTFDSIRLNGLYNLMPDSSLRPFLTLGGGMEMVKMPGVNEKGFAPNAGLGVKWYATDRFGLRLDGRYVLVKVRGAIDSWQNNFETFLSAFFSFGCHEKKVTSAPKAPTPVRAEPAPAPVAAPVVETKAPEPTKIEKIRGVLKGVNFKTASANLTEDSKKILDEVAKTLSEFPEIKVEVAGHTDNTGSPQTNSSLSQNRAETVLQYLVSKGVAKERLSAKGYGAEKPLADNKTSAGRKTNRRVELNW